MDITNLSQRQRVVSRAPHNEQDGGSFSSSACPMGRVSIDRWECDESRHDKETIFIMSRQVASKLKAVPHHVLPLNFVLNRNEDVRSLSLLSRLICNASLLPYQLVDLHCCCAEDFFIHARNTLMDASWPGNVPRGIAGVSLACRRHFSPCSLRRSITIPFRSVQEALA